MVVLNRCDDTYDDFQQPDEDFQQPVPRWARWRGRGEVNQPTADQGWWVGEVEREGRGETANVTNGGSGGLGPNPPLASCNLQAPVLGPRPRLRPGVLFFCAGPPGAKKLAQNIPH